MLIWIFLNNRLLQPILRIETGIRTLIGYCRGCLQRAYEAFALKNSSRYAYAWGAYREILFKSTQHNFLDKRHPDCIEWWIYHYSTLFTLAYYESRLKPIRRYLWPSKRPVCIHIVQFVQISMLLGDWSIKITIPSVCPEQNSGPLDGQNYWKNDAHEKSGKPKPYRIQLSMA